MTDRHPSTFAIDIDSRALTRYLRAQSLLLALFICCFFGLLFGFSSITEDLDQHTFKTIGELVVLLLKGTGGGILIGGSVALILYLLFAHIPVAKHAASIRVSVEGPFLHLKQGSRLRMDRKLHFRSLVDYSTLETPLMRRFGVKSLLITTTGWGGPQNMLRITGIKDCVKVRDMLAEIDSIRENGA